MKRIANVVQCHSLLKGLLGLFKGLTSCKLCWLLKGSSKLTKILLFPSSSVPLKRIHLLLSTIWHSCFSYSSSSLQFSLPSSSSASSESNRIHSANYRGQELRGSGRNPELLMLCTNIGTRHFQDISKENPEYSQMQIFDQKSEKYAQLKWPFNSASISSQFF